MKVRFADLEPKWVQFVGLGCWRSHAGDGCPIAPADADGIMFLHPQSFERNGGARGTSSVLIWFRGRVPAEATPGPGRWDLVNPDFAHFEVSPSIDLTMGGKHPDEWHGWIKDGWAI